LAQVPKDGERYVSLLDDGGLAGLLVGREGSAQRRARLLGFPHKPGSSRARTGPPGENVLPWRERRHRNSHFGARHLPCPGAGRSRAAALGPSDRCGWLRTGPILMSLESRFFFFSTV
jgi:hypothetical protein